MSHNNTLLQWYSPIEDVVGEYNPLKFDAIRRLIMTCEDRDESKCLDLEITACYGAKHVITFEILNARTLAVAEVEGSALQFGELFIDDVRERGLEHINYQLVDELGGVSCFCEEIRVLAISEVAGNNVNEIVWSA